MRLATTPLAVILVDPDPERPERSIRLGLGETVRDALVRQRIPHRSVCGGSSICGTCWVEVLSEGLPPPASDERALLERFATEAHNPRLACRLVPTTEQPVIRIRPPRRPRSP